MSRPVVPPKENIFTKARPGGKVVLPGGAGGRSKRFHKKYNFDKVKKKFEATGKLDLEDFNSADEIGMFLDWYNKGVENKKEKEADREVSAISKFLARTLGRTMIPMS